MAKIQLRGNCQCCCRLQAVREKGPTAGQSALHGYEVKDGWFNGVCQGNRYQPMQVERKITDGIILSVRADVENLKTKLNGIKDGSVLPPTCKVPNSMNDPVTNERVRRNPSLNYWENVSVPFLEGNVYQQEEAVKELIYKTESRISAGTSFANNMENLVNSVHGTALIENKIEDGPAPIQIGECRKMNGRTVSCSYIEKGKVFYDLGGGRRGYVSTRAWRLLAI